MCGIFGVVVGQNSGLTSTFTKKTVSLLFRLSESRGKEASGLVFRAGSQIIVLKEPVSATRLIKTEIFSNLFNNYVIKPDSSSDIIKKPFAVLGHSRLVTSGKSELNSNNQPVIKDGSVGIHNGVIVNEIRLWQDFPLIKKGWLLHHPCIHC